MIIICQSLYLRNYEDFSEKSNYTCLFSLATSFYVGIKHQIRIVFVNHLPMNINHIYLRNGTIFKCSWISTTIGNIQILRIKGINFFFFLYFEGSYDTEDRSNDAFEKLKLNFSFGNEDQSVTIRSSKASALDLLNNFQFLFFFATENDAENSALHHRNKLHYTNILQSKKLLKIVFPNSYCF